MSELRLASNSHNILKKKLNLSNRAHSWQLSQCKFIYENLYCHKPQGLINVCEK